MPKPADPTSRSRRQRGFEPAGQLLRAPIRKVGESRGFVESRLLTHWAEIAGPDMAALCRPAKVSYAQGGLGATLTLLVSGAAAPLVQMQAERLRDRVNACYGYAAISRVRITQTAATPAPGLAEAPATFEHSNIAAPSPQALNRARAVVGQLTDGVTDAGLRDALTRLAQNVLARGAGPKAGPEPKD